MKKMISFIFMTAVLMTSSAAFAEGDAAATGERNTASCPAEYSGSKASVEAQIIKQDAKEQSAGAGK